MLSDGLTRLFQEFLSATDNTVTFRRGLDRHDEIKRLRAFFKAVDTGYRIECVQRSDHRTNKKLIMKIRRIPLGQASNHPAQRSETVHS